MGDMTNTGGASAPPKIRDLKSTDVWQLARILSKIGLKDFRKSVDPAVIKATKFKAPQMLDKDGKTVPLPRDRWTEAQIEAETRAELANDEMMLAILGLIMDHIGNCERDVNKLLADGIGKSVSEIEEMDANNYLELVAAYISREGFRDFFTQAWRLVDRMAPSKKRF